MNSVARLAAAATALTWLVACGSQAPPASSEDAGPAPDAAARDGTADETVFDDLIQTEDKARSVEGTIMQGKANVDAALEAQTGDSEESEE
jgi:hypothetical protein